MERREFLQLSSVAPAWAQALTPGAAGPDAQTNPAGLQYYVLGNGLLVAGIQETSGPGSGTNTGVVLTSSEHLNRKPGSLVWSARSGLGMTRTRVVAGGVAYTPEPGRAVFSWTYPEGIPTLRIEWEAGACRVTEELFCPAGEPLLVRTVTVENRGGAAAAVTLVETLDPNRLFFDEYEVDREGGILRALGYHRLELYSTGVARARGRELEIPLGTLTPGARAQETSVLALDATGGRKDRAALVRLGKQTADYWRGVARFESGDGTLDRLFRVSQHGLRAAIARSGKMDGGIWQYITEWVRDEVMAATGALMAGMPEACEAVLNRVLERLVDDKGAGQDSGRERPPETIELDQNGELLFALWQHWAWTGSDEVIRKWWKRIRATADYVLDPVFRDAESGLLKNSRELWERSPEHGVRRGYEISYQAWNIAALPLAAEMAEHLGEAASAARWRDAAALMKRSMLGHPRLALVEDGRFIKRRLESGEQQRFMEPPNRAAIPEGMPLREEKISYCDPDAASVFPIVLGIVEGSSEVARKTLESMETLWNQRWNIGGYGRYHVTGEPDSPGPWPFATLFIARAYLEAGNSEKAWRAMRWLAGVPGGKSGAWFEFYGERPSPPLPPVAIIPWTWAEIVMFTVHHLLGFRPSPGGLTVRPRLLDGLSNVEARLRVGGHDVKLRVTRGPGGASARVNGESVPVKDEAIRLPRPAGDTVIEMRV